MRGQVTEIYKIFHGPNRRIVIPVYQRNYEWTEKQCGQLLDDLIDVHEHRRPKHFFGAIVGKPETSFKWIVIDGQQRLTTISLLILALSRLIDSGELEADDAELGARLRSSYLFDDATELDGKFRLKPVKNDAAAYQRLFADVESEFIDDSNVTRNYHYFLKQLRQRGLTGTDWWNAVSRLEVMHLDLEAHDEPQQIFESLNSTGIALSEADKVRNLVLMGLESKEQENVYENYWNRIEENVNFKTDEFLRRYLTSVTYAIPKADQVFEAFKEFARKRGSKGAELLEEVRAYSTYAREIELAQTTDRRINLHLERLKLLRIDVTIPFLMPLVGEFKKENLLADDFIEILRIVESYLARRMICGISTQGLNGIFVRLLRDIRRWWKDGERLSNIVAYALLAHRHGTSGDFPTDAKFGEAFVTRDIYKMGGKRHRYIFECLENQDSKDVRDIATRLASNNLSVEHIMPRKLSDTWRGELGPDADRIHEVWLDRIANLTVTGYNSEYSNASFEQKKTCSDGFNQSPYRLNQLLKERSSWGEAELRQRSDQLRQIALRYWSYPVTTFRPPTTQLPAKPLGHHTDFTNKSIIAYEWQGIRHSAPSWRQLLISLLQQLLPEYRTQILEYAARSSDFTLGKLESHRRYAPVTDGLAVLVHSSTRNKCAIIRRLFSYLHLDPEKLTIIFPSASDEQKESPTGQELQYGALNNFLSPLAQLATTDVNSHDVLRLADDFTKAFAPYMVGNPAELIGRTFPDLLMEDAKWRDNASIEQLLAVLSSAILMSASVDASLLRRTIVAGNLCATVERLVALANPGSGGSQARS